MKLKQTLSVASGQQSSLLILAALVKHVCGERSRHFYDKTPYNPNVKLRIARLQFCVSTMISCFKNIINYMQVQSDIRY